MTVTALAAALRSFVKVRIAPAKLLAAAIWLLGVGGIVISFVLWSRQRFAPPPVTFVTAPVLVGEMIVALAYASVGWLLASVRSRNPIGWLFLGMGVATAIQLPVILLARDADQARQLIPPGTVIAAWLASSAHIPFVGTLAILAFLFFPDGHLVGRRWALAGWAAAIGAWAAAVAMALYPGPLLWYRSLGNPFAAPASTTPLLWTIGVAGGVLFVLGLVAAGLSMVVRYERSNVKGRLQLRWIAFAVVLLTITAAPFLIVRYVLTVPDDVASLLAAVLVVAAGAFPLAAAIAILRHRLLDIDLIINRAFVYVPLSAILTGLFAFLATVVQRIFVALTGDTSDIAIVLATIVVAATVTPLQRALQDVADRHVQPADAGAVSEATGAAAVSAPAVAGAGGIPARAAGRRSSPGAAAGAPSELEPLLHPILSRLDRLEGRIADLEAGGPGAGRAAPGRPAPRGRGAGGPSPGGPAAERSPDASPAQEERPA